jgi:hypothetical protein
MISILVIWALGPDLTQNLRETYRRRKSFFHESSAQTPKHVEGMRRKGIMIIDLWGKFDSM